MTKLNKYIKTPTRENVVITSVNIEKRHHEFIKKLNLNMSQLIRDYIDQLIKENEK